MTRIRTGCFLAFLVPVPVPVPLPVPALAMALARASSRSMSSMTIRPTPASVAIVSSAVVLALPCITIRAGSTPPARAITSSPPPATSTPMSCCAISRYTAVHGKALEAQTIRAPGQFSSRACRNRRTWAPMASSSMTNSGVPQAAARSASRHPPTTSSPSGSRREPGGNRPSSSAAVVGTGASSGSDMLGEAQGGVFLLGVGDGVPDVGDDPLGAETAVDSVVVDDQAEHRHRGDVPPERHVVADLDAEDARIAADVAAAEDREDRQADDPRQAEGAGLEVDRRLVRVNQPGDEVQHEEEQHRQVQLDHVRRAAPVDDQAGHHEAERPDDVQAGDLVR